MISLNECAAIAGLRPRELVLGVAVSERHHRMLSNYLLNVKRGAAVVCAIIVADMRGYRDLGALQKSADLLIVLRLFLSKHRLEPRAALRRFTWANGETRRPPLEAAKRAATSNRSWRTPRLAAPIGASAALRRQPSHHSRMS